MAHFNNENGQRRTNLAREVFNQFLGDDRVSQVLDPLYLRSKEPVYEYDNNWQNVYNVYLLTQGISLASFDQMSKNEQLAYLGGNTREGRERRNMLLHRDHLHISVVNY